MLGGHGWASCVQPFPSGPRRRPQGLVARCYLVASLTQLGRLDEARVELGEALRLRPEGTLGHARLHFPSYADPNLVERYLDGLRKAG